MKLFVKYAIVAAVSFVAGGVAGWFTRKKTSEVVFEEITAEEQEELMRKDMTAIQNDIHDAVDRTFSNETPPKLDTQKMQYFKQWKAEEAIDKYDTTTKETPEDVVTTDELEKDFDKDFIDGLEHDSDVSYGKPDIEPASIEDWTHWAGIADGEYDTDEVYYFTKDDVVTDDSGEPIDNPIKYLGFDPEKMFEKADEELTGDPNICVVYNHKDHNIVKVIRKNCSYNRKTWMEEYGGDDDSGEDDYQ